MENRNRMPASIALAKTIKRKNGGKYFMRTRKSNNLFMPGRKPKFAGKETKWESKRRNRPAKRAAQGKLPLVEPLIIAPVEERQAALKQGKMVFYDGAARIELPLVTYRLLTTRRAGGFDDAQRLAGVYKAPSSGIFTLRSGLTHLWVYKLGHTKKGFVENPTDAGYFSKLADLGHMDLRRSNLMGRGLGVKGASKAERHQRALHKGKHSFEMLPKFQRIFTKIGYENRGTVRRKDEVNSRFKMKKTGKAQPKDNLKKFYRIEAIDPKNGKARMFTFPIKGNSRKQL